MNLGASLLVLHSLTHSFSKGLQPRVRAGVGAAKQSEDSQPGGRESLVDTALLPVTTPPRVSLPGPSPHLLAHRAPPPVRLGEAFRPKGIWVCSSSKPTERKKDLSTHSSGTS